MRIRHKPWAKEELAKCDFFVDNPSKNIGKWANKFKKEQPLYLELGCGKGNFISKTAVNNPNINYLAIDVKSDMLGIAKRNIEKEYLKAQRKIDNILIMAYEIGLIENIFNEKDIIDRIYINFCNPWPKPRHNKRRLTYPTFLEKYKKFLKQNGEIFFKTDDENLFNASIKYLKDTDFEIVYITYDLHIEKDVENIITEHEEMFSKKGIKIKALIARKN